MQPNIKAKLDRYHDLLLQWQAKINLVSPNSIEDAWNRHFIDSIQIEQYIKDDTKSISDIGSGAGFPGLVLAIMRPDIQFHMVESDARKCTFLRNVSRETECINVTVHTSRIEEKLPDLNVDCITARALAPLKQLIEYTQSQWENNIEFNMIIPKGRQYLDEIDDAESMFTFDYAEHQSQTSDDAIILTVSNIIQK
jgi:16S rRNA (guanine527-N7)-methyltransferase